MKNAWSLAFRRMYRPVKMGCAVGLLSIGATLPLQAADRESVYQEAREFLKQNQPADAYQLLIAYELDWAGDDGYDYLLGVAALDSGEPGEAIFSLQRIVVRRPAFAGARMELARAYYDIGDNELARIEFERILADTPPPNVEAAATQYMAAINNKARAYTSTFDFYIDQGFGYDSNAPAATDESVFLNLTLSPNNLEQSSSFSQTTLGGMWNKPLTPDSGMMLGARLDHRINPSAHFVDATNFDLSAGWNYQAGDHGLSVMANTTLSALDREHNKNVYGLMVNYAYKLNDSWSMSAFVQRSAMRFEEAALEVRDVDQTVYGLAFNQSADSRTFSLSLTGMGDDTKESNSNFGNDGYGVRLSNSWFRPGGRVYFVEASANTVEYDDQFFNIDREEDTWSVAAGASFAKFPANDWTTTVRMSYSEKDSTVSLYEFSRLEVGLSIKKFF